MQMECVFCLNGFHNNGFGVMVNNALSEKYSESQKFFYLRES